MLRLAPSNKPTSTVVPPAAHIPVSLVCTWDICAHTRVPIRVCHAGMWTAFAAHGVPLPPISRSLSDPRLLNQTYWPRMDGPKGSSSSSSTGVPSVPFQINYYHPGVQNAVALAGGVSAAVAAAERCRFWDDVHGYLDTKGDYLLDA